MVKQKLPGVSRSGETSDPQEDADPLGRPQPPSWGMGWLSRLFAWRQMDFSLVLTMITFLLITSGTYTIPMIRVRTYLLLSDNKNPNISALLNYNQYYVEDNWAIFDFPESVDRLLELAEDVIGRLGQGENIRNLLLGESRLSYFSYLNETIESTVKKYRIEMLTTYFVFRKTAGYTLARLFHILPTHPCSSYCLVHHSHPDSRPPFLEASVSGRSLLRSSYLPRWDL